MKNCRSSVIAVAGLWIGCSSFAGFAAEQVKAVETPPLSAMNSYYVANRAPLTPSPFIKLPIGSITPRGWVRHQLELERDGMIGRLKEISGWLDFGKSSWADKEGRGKYGWEEMPYWLKGYGDLGYVLKDDAIIAEAKKWIEATMASQREDGWFGPRDSLTSLKGKPDMWPHMVMLNILQSYYEFSGDKHTLDVIVRYLKWQNTLPASAFGEGYWPKVRAGDNIETALWAYNRTGEAWLLDLAKKIHEGMARWDEKVINWHNVNLAQGFRAGTVAWMVTKDPNHLASAERNYNELMDIYGQFAGGGFVGDENCRQGIIDPRGGIETCGIVEFMHSYEMLLKITGNPVWADRCEDIAFNSFPAAMTPDQKGLHYITCANQVQLDRHNKAPGIQNDGTMFSYSPFECYRCCQHNVSHGWPYYAEELWLATPDNGLCASLYAASEVSAQVGSGVTVKISEETDYPFSDTITFKVSAPTKVEFPLYLRVPRWCARPVIKVNGQAAKGTIRPSSFAVLNREWKGGDTVTLRLPMKIAVRTWAKNKNSVSVDYGPLSFSLAIQERWEKYGNRDANWPEWEVFAKSPWNYGLVLKEKSPAKSFRLETKPGPLAPQPFTPQTVPISLKVKARKIPAWQYDHNNMPGVLQPSPAKSDQPIEEVTLIPMGAARLRIASFPTIGSGPDAHEWVVPSKPKASPYKATASVSHEKDTVVALADGLEPTASNDQTIPHFSWRPHRGTAEWAQYDFEKPRAVRRVSIYWFDNSGADSLTERAKQCRVPESWRLLYKSGDEWKPVPGVDELTVRKDTWNHARFPTISTTGLRIETKLRPDYSAGILEWKVIGE